MQSFRMCCPNTPHSHNLGDIRNVANAVTGFMAGSCVGLDIYLVFFYLDIYKVNFSLLHNSKDVSVVSIFCDHNWFILQMVTKFITF